MRKGKELFNTSFHTLFTLINIFLYNLIHMNKTVAQIKLVIQFNFLLKFGKKANYVSGDSNDINTGTMNLYLLYQQGKILFMFTYTQ